MFRIGRPANDNIEPEVHLRVQRIAALWASVRAVATHPTGAVMAQAPGHEQRAGKPR